MKVNKLTIISGIAIIVAAGIIGIWQLSKFALTGTKPESLRVCMEATAVNSLIYIAVDKGFFKAHDIEARIVDTFQSGVASVEALLRGEAEMATASEFVLARNALSEKRIVTLASIDRFSHQYIVGKKSAGVSGISDLAGKRIGVSKKTAAEFNLGRFLTINRIDPNRVTIVDVQPAAAGDAFMSGELDAVVIWQPFLLDIMTRSKNDLAVWSVQNDQPTHCLLIANESWAHANADAARRFLEALSKANDFVYTANKEAKAFIQKRLDYSDEYIARIWPEHELSLSLDQSVVTEMEDESRWLIGNGLATNAEVPNFLAYISEASLAKVKPESVRIIR